MDKTIRMTVAQAIVKFLDNQYVSMDGVETKFVEGFYTLFGHGIAVGLGEALDTNPGNLKVFQGRNEQGMCHTAIAFAKQHNRKKIIPCASSIGPGAANMVTACATATVNNIPLLVFPADTFASRQPDPVLQQLDLHFRRNRLFPDDLLGGCRGSCALGQDHRCIRIDRIAGHILEAGLTECLLRKGIAAAFHAIHKHTSFL